MVATNRTAGITQQFRAQTTGQTRSGGTTPSTNTSQNTINTNDVIANNFLKAPNFGFQNTTIPGQSESALKITAAMTSANFWTQMGIGRIVEDSIMGLAKVFKKDTENNEDKKPKESLVAKNETPEPTESSDITTTT